MLTERQSGINNDDSHGYVDKEQLPHVNGDGTLVHDTTRQTPDNRKVGDINKLNESHSNDERSTNDHKNEIQANLVTKQNPQTHNGQEEDQENAIASLIGSGDRGEHFNAQHASQVWHNGVQSQITCTQDQCENE